MTNADTIASRIYDREGMDHDEDIGDGAGVTHIGGQTDVWLAQWSLTAPTDRASAEQNVTAWLRLSGLQAIVDRSLPLGDAVADWAFNSDERAAVRGLQAALGVTVDGTIGPVTLGALATADTAALARQVAKDRLHFLGLAFTHGTISMTFASGLIDRSLTFL